MTNTLDDFSLEGLKTLVDSLFERESTFSIEHLAKAYRHIHSFQHRYATRFKSFSIKNSHEPDVRISCFEDTEPGLDPSLDRICNYVATGTSPYDLPQGESSFRSAEEEKKLLEQELSRVREYRGRIVEEAKRVNLGINAKDLGILRICNPSDSFRSAAFLDCLCRQRLKGFCLDSLPISDSATDRERVKNNNFSCRKFSK